MEWKSLTDDQFLRALNVAPATIPEPKPLPFTEWPEVAQLRLINDLQCSPADLLTDAHCQIEYLGFELDEQIKLTQHNRLGVEAFRRLASRRTNCMWVAIAFGAAGWATALLRRSGGQ